MSDNQSARRLSRLRLVVSDDALSASVCVVAQTDAAPTVDQALDLAQLATEIRGWLKSLSVSSPGDTELLEHAVDQIAAALLEAQASAAIACAVGRAALPKHGEYIEAAQSTVIRAGTRREDGSFDFAERGLLTPVAATQIVGYVRLASTGQDGQNIRGAAIAAPRLQRQNTPLGDGVLRDQNNQIVAVIAGNLVFREGSLIAVEALHEHVGNVDLRSGSLHTSRHLRVQGNIEKNFIAQADGSLEIRGSVSGGSAIAGEDLLITGGVVGTSTSKIASGGNLSLLHAQTASLACDGHLEVARDVVQSQVHARSATIAGHVIASDVWVQTILRAQTIGNSQQAAVNLHLGQAVSDTVAQALALVAQQQTDRRQRIRIRERSSGRVAREQLSMQDNLLSEKIQARREANLLAQQARIYVSDVLHAGVEIVFGTYSLFTDISHQCVEVRLDGNQITFIPYLP